MYIHEHHRHRYSYSYRHRYKHSYSDRRRHSFTHRTCPTPKAPKMTANMAVKKSLYWTVPSSTRVAPT